MRRLLETYSALCCLSISKICLSFLSKSSAVFDSLSFISSSSRCIFPRLKQQGKIMIKMKNNKNWGISITKGLCMLAYFCWMFWKKKKVFQRQARTTACLICVLERMINLRRCFLFSFQVIKERTSALTTIWMVRNVSDNFFKGCFMATPELSYIFEFNTLP